MQRVNYALPDYPKLSFTTTIEGSQHYQVKHATIETKGPTDAIIKWWQDLEHWCEERADCVLGNKGLRSGYTNPAFVTLVSGPETLVAFIVQWLGLDWLEQLLQEGLTNTSSATRDRSYSLQELPADRCGRLPPPSGRPSSPWHARAATK